MLEAEAGDAGGAGSCGEVGGGEDKNVVRSRFGWCRFVVAVAPEEGAALGQRHGGAEWSRSRGRFNLRCAAMASDAGV